LEESQKRLILQYQDYLGIDAQFMIDMLERPKENMQTNAFVAVTQVTCQVRLDMLTSLEPLLILPTDIKA